MILVMAPGVQTRSGLATYGTKLDPLVRNFARIFMVSRAIARHCADIRHLFHRIVAPPGIGILPAALGVFAATSLPRGWNVSWGENQNAPETGRATSSLPRFALEQFRNYQVNKLLI
jgi:hypothetical protein